MIEVINPFETKDIKERNVDNQLIVFYKQKLFLTLNEIQLIDNKMKLAQKLYLNDAEKKLPAALSVATTFFVGLLLVGLLYSVVIAITVGMLIFVGFTAYQSHCSNDYQAEAKNYKKIFNSEYSRELVLFPPNNSNKKSELGEKNQKQLSFYTS